MAPRKVGENDLLYGSVTSADVGDFLESKGIEVDKRRVLLDERAFSRVECSRPKQQICRYADLSEVV